MTEKSGSSKGQLFSLVLIILVLAMGFEIFLLARENRKLRSALNAPRGPFKILHPEEKVPPLVGVDQKGEEVRVEYPSSKKTVLFWFSAACPSCEHNLDFWKEIYQTHGNAGVRFFGVTRSGEEKTEELVAKFQLDFPIMIVSDFSLLDQYRVEVIPQTMLIDDNGIVRKVWPGALSESYKKEIEEMISSPSQS
jgi:peroxiredoxin